MTDLCECLAFHNPNSSYRTKEDSINENELTDTVSLSLPEKAKLEKIRKDSVYVRHEKCHAIHHLIGNKKDIEHIFQCDFLSE